MHKLLRKRWIRFRQAMNRLKGAEIGRRVHEVSGRREEVSLPEQADRRLGVLDRGSKAGAQALGCYPGERGHQPGMEAEAFLGVRGLELLRQRRARGEALNPVGAQSSNLFPPHQHGNVRHPCGHRTLNLGLSYWAPAWK
jgi:hypothetical protein